MNEVKKPKKPIYIFYAVVLCLILFFNLFVIPSVLRAQVKEVGYAMSNAQKRN